MKKVKFNAIDALVSLLILLFTLTEIVYWGMTIHFLVLTLENASCKNIGWLIVGSVISIVPYLVYPYSVRIKDLKEYFPFHINRNIEEWF